MENSLTCPSLNTTNSSIHLNDRSLNAAICILHLQHFSDTNATKHRGVRAPERDSSSVICCLSTSRFSEFDFIFTLSIIKSCCVYNRTVAWAACRVWRSCLYWVLWPVCTHTKTTDMSLREHTPGCFDREQKCYHVFLFFPVIALPVADCNNKCFWGSLSLFIFIFLSSRSVGANPLSGWGLRPGSR